MGPHQGRGGGGEVPRTSVDILGIFRKKVITASPALYKEKNYAGSWGSRQQAERGGGGERGGLKAEGWQRRGVRHRIIKNRPHWQIELW